MRFPLEFDQYVTAATVAPKANNEPKLLPGLLGALYGAVCSDLRRGTRVNERNMMMLEEQGNALGDAE